eukprot:359047-Chlamydomonas_euryale.AAC.1
MRRCAGWCLSSCPVFTACTARHGQGTRNKSTSTPLTAHQSTLSNLKGKLHVLPGLDAGDPKGMEGCRAPFPECKSSHASPPVRVLPESPPAQVPQRKSAHATSPRKSTRASPPAQVSQCKPSSASPQHTSPKPSRASPQHKSPKPSSASPQHKSPSATGPEADSAVFAQHHPRWPCLLPAHDVPPA